MRKSETTVRPPKADRARVALVTGASSGIGLATSLVLAKAGWTTVATIRNMADESTVRAAAMAAGVVVEVRQLDVTVPVSIEQGVARVISEHGRLDAVINNAGAAALGTVELMEMEQFRASIDVNFLGAVAVTKAALPHLRATRGRIVSVGSVGGIVGQPFNEAYCAAKFALEGFMESLHPVARTVGVAVSLVEPAAVTSEFVANADIDVHEMLVGAGPYRAAMRNSLERTQRQFDPSVAQSPAEVAAVILDALETTEPAFRIPASASARALIGLKIADIDGSQTTSLTHSWLR